MTLLYIYLHYCWCYFQHHIWLLKTVSYRNHISYMYERDGSGCDDGNSTKNSEGRWYINNVNYFHVTSKFFKIVVLIWSEILGILAKYWPRFFHWESSQYSCAPLCNHLYTIHLQWIWPGWYNYIHHHYYRAIICLKYIYSKHDQTARFVLWT